MTLIGLTVRGHSVGRMITRAAIDCDYAGCWCAQCVSKDASPSRNLRGTNASLLIEAVECVSKTSMITIILPYAPDVRITCSDAIEAAEIVLRLVPEQQQQQRAKQDWRCDCKRCVKERTEHRTQWVTINLECVDQIARGAAMKVTLCTYVELPEWVNHNHLSDNGSGKEYANYLLIEDGDYRACYSDAMEPEDRSFHRDLKWIKSELERAYAAKENATVKGLQDTVVLVSILDCVACELCGEHQNA